MSTRSNKRHHMRIKLLQVSWCPLLFVFHPFPARSWCWTWNKSHFVEPPFPRELWRGKRTDPALGRHVPYPTFRYLIPNHQHHPPYFFSKSLIRCNFNTNKCATKNFIEMPDSQHSHYLTITLACEMQWHKIVVSPSVETPLLNARGKIHRPRKSGTKMNIPSSILADFTKDTGILEVMLGNQSKVCGNALRRLETNTAILACGLVICCPVFSSISCSSVCETYVPKPFASGLHTYGSKKHSWTAHPISYSKNYTSLILMKDTKPTRFLKQCSAGD